MTDEYLASIIERLNADLTLLAEITGVEQQTRAAASPSPRPALLVFEGRRAARCVVYPGEHRPRPLRFVWHHILPEVAGGTAVPSNLLECCDNCHIAIHALLWALAAGYKVPARVGTVEQRRFAKVGFDLAVLNGTAKLIPNEGSILNDARTLWETL